MSGVKRYDPFGYDGLSALMHEDDLGGWVCTENYEALEIERDALRAEVERLREIREIASQCAANGGYLCSRDLIELRELLKK